MIHPLERGCQDRRASLIIISMDLSVKSKLAKRIQELRKRRGLTQEKLAEITGIKYKYFQTIEGKNSPNMRVETLEKIAKVLKIEISFLFKFK